MRTFYNMPRIPLLLVLALTFVASAAADALTTQDPHALELVEHQHDSDHELESDGVMVRCRSCGAPVAYKKCAFHSLLLLAAAYSFLCYCRDYIDLHDTSKAVGSRHEAVLGDDTELFTFVNPSRVRQQHFW